MFYAFAKNDIFQLSKAFYAGFIHPIAKNVKTNAKEPRSLPPDSFFETKFQKSLDKNICFGISYFQNKCFGDSYGTHRTTF